MISGFVRMIKERKEGKVIIERSFGKDLVGECLAATRVKLYLVIEQRKILAFGTWLTEEAQLDDEEQS